MVIFNFIIAIVLLLFIPYIGFKMIFGSKTTDYVTSRLIYNFIKAIIRLPVKLISFIVKFPRH